MCVWGVGQGTQALRSTFDSVHPPLTLRQHLAQHHVRSLLHKLWDHKVIKGQVCLYEV